MTLVPGTLALLLVAYLPGALIVRLPVGERSRRAALAAEERVFWSILLSLVLSSFTSLGLASAGWYQFDRLLWINGAVSLLMLALGRGRLRLGPSAPNPTWTALLPLGLVVAGLWLNFFVPPSEYIMGGKDPGVYMNEGIQIAQRGTLVFSDEAARLVPPPHRDLFFRRQDDPSYYASRFMGFFLLDPGTGAVVGQFPHLYPIWIAIGYGLNGLSGARWVSCAWAALGLLAVYFAGARIMGRAAAAAGAGLLAVHVMQVWYARYPNAEIVMQPLVFAGVLAYVRAEADGDRFFAPVAALILVLGVFAHFTGVLAVAAVAIAALLAFVSSRRAPLAFGLPLVAGTCLAVAHLAFYLPPYFRLPVGFFSNLQPLQLALLALAAIAGLVILHRTRHAAAAERVRTWVPTFLVAAVWTLAAYAFFIRSAGGSLAPHDADSLRTFASFYLSPYALAAALIGFALVARSSPAGTAFLLTVAVFSSFFFYKIRVVPEHFWAARRFLPVILPGSLLLVGAAAFCDARPAAVGGLAWLNRRGIRVARYLVGLALVLLLGRHFFGATQAILRHVEYAGLIPRLENLAATFGDDDLVLVESRGASDVHVLALPLAYIYARNVLVIAAVDPDKRVFREFLIWAQQRYRRVFFVGGGGTELLSRTMTVNPIGGQRFQIPEYESVRNAYPRRARFKEFDLSVYEFLPRPGEADGFNLKVGLMDDLYVRRFYAKERHSNGFTFRWTRDVSFVSILGTRPDHQRLTLWLADGGRPPAAGPADVEVFLNDQPLGAVTVGPELKPYRFAIPPELAAAVARSEEAAQLRILSRTWNPKQLLGVDDNRELGVMADRIEIK